MSNLDLLKKLRDITGAGMMDCKKYLKKSTLKELSSPLKYLLAVRDNDPTQEEMSIGPGAEYRKKFGK